MGKLDGKDVFQLETKGGLFLVATLEDTGKPKVLAMAPHPGVSKHMAQAKKPEIAWDLTKSEGLYSYDLPLESFAHLLPKYEALTALYQSEE